jgi:hypothetical protein
VNVPKSARAGRRPESYTRWSFAQAQPQEKFPEAAIREAGYGAIWNGQKSWNGVAILARGPGSFEETSKPAG